MILLAISVMLVAQVKRQEREKETLIWLADIFKTGRF